MIWEDLCFWWKGGWGISGLKDPSAGDTLVNVYRGNRHMASAGFQASSHCSREIFVLGGNGEGEISGLLDPATGETFSTMHRGTRHTARLVSRHLHFPQGRFIVINLSIKVMI